MRPTASLPPTQSIHSSATVARNWAPASRTPLAWKNLINDARRLLLAVGGIGFAVLLMFMQLGFQGALLESTTALPRLLNADLVLVSKSRFALLIQERFSRTALYEAESVADVKAVFPLYFEMQRANWRPSWHVKQSLPIRVVAFHPTQPIFTSESLSVETHELLKPDSALFDAHSKSDYGQPTAGATALLNGRPIHVRGLFELGTDFATDATLLISDQTFAHWFAAPGMGNDPLSEVDLGLVHVSDSSAIPRIQRELRAVLPAMIAVKTKAEFVADEQEFWNRSTPIGYIFGFGVTLGFVVGVIICYQILYADVNDHLPEYATLMAMGYPARFFLGVILQQSLLLSLLAFGPALLLSWGLYQFLGVVTGLAFHLYLARAAGVLALTVAMCAVSGMLALRRLLAAEPAELFR